MLFGAELSFAYQNIRKFEFEKIAKEMSYEYRKKALLVVMHQIIAHFLARDGAVSSETVAQDLNLPVRIVRDAVFDLEKAGLIVSTVSKEDKVNLYVPARDVHTLRVCDVIQQVEASGMASLDLQQSPEFRQIDAIVNRLNLTVSRSADNVLLMDVRTE